MVPISLRNTHLKNNNYLEKWTHLRIKVELKDVKYTQDEVSLNNILSKYSTLMQYVHCQWIQYLTVFIMIFCSILTFITIDYITYVFHVHYLSVKRFGYRSGPTFCRSWSGSKLFAKAKVIGRRQKSPLTREELKFYCCFVGAWLCRLLQVPISDERYVKIRTMKKIQLLSIIETIHETAW